FTYFFTKNFAAELILTYPQKLDVNLAGAHIGSFKALPPTLTAQWHFLPEGPVDPYIGAGVNLTLISSVDLAGGTLDLDSSSVGLAGQVGLDIKVAPKWVINLDAKYVQISSDVKAGSAKISAVQLDPWLLGAGVGYRF
ncbi:MAG: OmpW family protein, partial [Deltaproteobacteria bacterium]|nr:OmpW family protein [Deltaproteobacteria bacterium]